MPARLTLIVPDLSLPAGPVQDVQERYPHLERLIARGSWRFEYPAADVRAATLRPWQRALLAAAGLEGFAEQTPGLPSAAVVARAAPLGATQGYWMHVDPVHLVAGIERLELTMLGPFELEVAEREALRLSIAEYLKDAGGELVTASDGAWLLRADRALDVTTYCAELAMAADMHTAMPRGPDTGSLRRLLTELQMLLHTHPVNVLRESRGLRVANGIWAWGAGTLPPPEQRPLPQAVGNDPFLQGLWQLFQQQSEPEAADGAQLVARCRAHTLAVARVSDLAALERQWLNPLARALAVGRLSILELVLDGWHLKVERRALLRLWRRSRPVLGQPT